MTASKSIDARVEALLAAEANRSEIERIDPEGALTEDEAYALQFQLIDQRLGPSNGTDQRDGRRSNRRLDTWRGGKRHSDRSGCEAVNCNE